MADKPASKTDAKGYREFIKEPIIQEIKLSGNEKISMRYFLYPLDMLEPLADKNPDAKRDIYFTIAINSYLGLFTEKDDEKAFKYFTLLANKYNSLIAQLICANFHLLGIGTEKNLTQAFKTYSSMKNYEPALYNYAYCLELGLGTKKDEEAAFAIYKKLCSKGSFPLAANRLANCYYYGIGTTKNIFVAKNYYDDAAYICHPNALLMLGHMHYFGIECIVNVDKAFEYLYNANETEAQFTFYETLNIVDVCFGDAINMNFLYLCKLSAAYPNNDWYTMLLSDIYLKREDYSTAKPLLEKLVGNEYCEVKYVYNSLKNQGAYNDPYGDHLLELTKLAYIHYHSGAMSYLSDLYFEYVTRENKKYPSEITQIIISDKERYIHDCTLAVYDKLSNNSPNNPFFYPWVVYEKVCIYYFGLGVPPERENALKGLGDSYSPEYYKSDLMNAFMIWNQLKDNFPSNLKLARERLKRLRDCVKGLGIDCINVLYVIFAMKFNLICTTNETGNKISGEYITKAAKSIVNEKLRNFVIASFLESYDNASYTLMRNLYIQCVNVNVPSTLEVNTDNICDHLIIKSIVNYLENIHYHKYQDIDGLCFDRIGELFLFGSNDHNNASKYLRLAADNPTYPYKDKALLNLMRTMFVRKGLFSDENVDYVFSSAKMADGEFTDDDMHWLSRNNDDIYHVLRFYFDSWRDNEKSIIFHELAEHNNLVANFIINLGDIKNTELKNFSFDEHSNYGIFCHLPVPHFDMMVFAAKNMIFEYALNLERGIGADEDIPLAMEYYVSLLETDIRAGLRLAEIYCEQNKINEAVKIYRNYIGKNIPEAFVKLAELADSGKIHGTGKTNTKTDNNKDIDNNTVLRMRIKAAMLKNSYSTNFI